MRLSALLLLFAASAVAAPVPKEIRNRDVLLGTWLVSEARENGRDITPPLLPQVFEVTAGAVVNRVLVFADERFPEGVVWRVPRGKTAGKLGHLTVVKSDGGELVLTIGENNLFRYVLKRQEEK